MSVDEIAPRPRLQNRGRVSGEARLARILFFAGPFLLALLIFSPRFILNSKRVKIAIADELADQVRRRTGLSIDQMGGVNFGWAYEPCLQSSQFFRRRPPYRFSAKMDSACVEQWPSAVGSGFRAIRLVLKNLNLDVEGGQNAIQIEKSSSRQAKAAAAIAQKASGPRKRPDLREVKVVFDDMQVNWNKLPLPGRLSKGSFGPIDGSVTIQKRGTQSAATIQLTEPLTGLEIIGRALPTELGWDVTGRVSGDLANSFGPLFAAAGLDVRRLPTRGQIGVYYEKESGLVTMDIDLIQSNVDIANRLVSSKRLQGFRARQKVRLKVNLVKNRVVIENGLFEVNGVPALFSLDASLSEGSPKFTAQLELPTIPMLQLLESIPGTKRPDSLKELSATALFALKFSISGALNAPEDWVLNLDHSLAGVDESNQAHGLTYLSMPFTYYPLTKTGRSEQGFQTGPMTKSWIGYKKVPYSQRRLIQVSEDASFFVHKGVDLDAIKAAVVAGLTSTSQVRGGSTLTQQLVKNLFLSRDRTALRKVQELFLTFLLESSLSKETIFELYMNVIEWGPNIYGLSKASEYYFDKPHNKLSLREMAYLTSIIPGPILYHKYFVEKNIPLKHNQKINLMLRRLRRLNTIKTDEELDAALLEQLRFSRKQKSVTHQQK